MLRKLKLLWDDLKSHITTKKHKLSINPFEDLLSSDFKILLVNCVSISDAIKAYSSVALFDNKFKNGCRYELIVENTGEYFKVIKSQKKNFYTVKKLEED